MIQIIITQSDINLGIMFLTLTIVVSIICAWYDLNYGYFSRR